VNGELPKGWVWTSLGEVTENPQYGWTTRATTEGNVHLLRTTDITSGKIDWSSVPYCEEEPEDIQKYLLKEGDIVISRAGSVGYSYLLDNPQNSIFASYLIRFKPLINNCFLSYFLKSPIYWEAISEKSIGIAMANVNAPKLKQIEIPLPPLAEQQRIVNKIEELFTNLDKGIESLEQVKYKLKVYRQAILKHAMEGKLTEKWREENKNRVESEILQLIKSLKEKQKIMTDDNSNDLDDTYSPSSWVRLRLMELTKTINPGFPCGRHNNEGRGVLHVRPMNIDREGRISLVNTKYVETNIYDSLGKGDILFNNTNSSELVGKTTYIESDTNWAYSNHMTRIRINNPLVNNKWISTYLHFLFLSGYFGGICIHHVNQSSVSIRVLSEKIPIPIPSISEQNFILQIIDQYFSIVDKEFETINYLLEQSKNLRQSILKKAFEGKLVPQYPNEESAEILLENIKNQKSNKEKLIQEKMR